MSLLYYYKPIFRRWGDDRKERVLPERKKKRKKKDKKALSRVEIAKREDEELLIMLGLL